jgi:hypothetical protein
MNVVDVSAALAQVSQQRQPLPSSPLAWLQEASTRFASQPALRFGLRASKALPHVCTYRDLWTGIQQTAALLRQLGIKPADRVLMSLPNVPETIEVLWGASQVAQLGILNPLLPETELLQAMQQWAPKVLITLAPYPDLDIWERMEVIRDPQPSLETILQVDLAGKYLGKLKRWQVRQVLRRKGKAEPVAGQQIGDLLASRAKTQVAEAEVPIMQGSLSCWDGSTWHKYEGDQLVKLSAVLGKELAAAPTPRQAWLEMLADPLTICRDGLLPFVSGGCLLGMGPLGAQSAVIREALPKLFQREMVQAALIRGGSFSQLRPPDTEAAFPWWIEVESGAQAAIQDHLDQVDPAATLIWSDAKGIPQQIAPVSAGKSAVGLLPSPLPLTAAQEMEALLATHPAIWAAVIVSAQKVGKPTFPVAYVQLRPDKAAGPKEIYEFAKAHAKEPEVVPQGIRIVDVLPLGADGRFDRAKLSQAESS